MNQYQKLRDRQQQEFNALPLGFAFSDKQFREVMQAWGLDPEKVYVDEETGRKYSGALLMHAGLDLSQPWPGPADGSSVLKHFTAE